MTIEMRVPEVTLCDYCKNPESPLTKSNGQNLFQRNWKGKETTRANVHRECAEPWAAAHGGIVVPDQLVPPRPSWVV